MNDMRVLVANEPNVYRGAIAEALRELRPHVQVSTAEPSDDLDRVVERLEPRLAVCSRISALVVVEALLGWVSCPTRTARTGRHTAPPSLHHGYGGRDGGTRTWHTNG